MTTIPLPRPISVNNLYINRGRARVASERYRTWRRAAEWTARAGGPIEPVAGPVAIELHVSEQGVRANMDLDNTAKAYLDLLVSLGAIEDDNRKILRSLSLRWITAAEGWATITRLEE